MIFCYYNWLEKILKFNQHIWNYMFDVILTKIQAAHLIIIYTDQNVCGV